MRTRPRVVWTSPIVLAVVAVIAMFAAGLFADGACQWSCVLDVESLEPEVLQESAEALLPGPSESSAVGEGAMRRPVRAWAFHVGAASERLAELWGCEPRPARSVLCWFDEEGQLTETVILEGDVWAEVSREGGRLLLCDEAEERPDGTRVRPVTCETRDGRRLMERELPDGQSLLSPDGELFVWWPRGVRQTELRSCAGELLATVPGGHGPIYGLDASFSPTGERLAVLKDIKDKSRVPRVENTLLTVLGSSGDVLAERELGNILRAAPAWHGNDLYVLCARAGRHAGLSQRTARLVAVRENGQVEHVDLDELGVAHEVLLSVSPDGSVIHVAVRRDGGASGWRVLTMSSEGLKPLTTVPLDGMNLTDIAAGPDGSLALLVPDPEADCHRLYIVAGGTRHLASDWPWWISSMQTSPDGEFLILAGHSRRSSWRGVHAVPWR